MTPSRRCRRSGRLSAVDESGVEVIARRALAMHSELDGVPESSNAVRVMVSSGEPGFSSSNPASDKLAPQAPMRWAGQPDMDAPGPQRLV